MFIYIFMSFDLGDSPSKEEWRWWSDGWAQCRISWFALFALMVLTLTVLAVLANKSIATLFLAELLLCAVVTTSRIGYQRLDLIRIHRGVETMKKRLFVLSLLGAATVGCWMFALYLFILPASDKAISPWDSRAQNTPCYMLEYFDTHGMIRRSHTDSSLVDRRLLNSFFLCLFVEQMCGTVSLVLDCSF